LPASERKTIIDRFTEDPDTKVFLSTDAGGVGVNLQTANILINIDLPWNPAVLEQRIGRIFRLGQKKHINVFNFIAKGSIEHRILYLLDFKRTVFTGVIEEEGKDEVMLEGFMDSVRALTEIDTESYVKNSFQQQPFAVNEKESIRRKNEETSENPETSAAADSIKTASTCVKNSYPSGSLMSRLGGFLKKLAAKILNRD
jgi:superfamily II DNA or RNA helicase